MFKYDLWYDGQVIHSEVDEFETEDEAREDAEMVIDSRCDYWDADGVEYDRSLFDIDICESEI
jgi:hypothetical protein